MFGVRTPASRIENAGLLYIVFTPCIAHEEGPTTLQLGYTIHSLVSWSGGLRELSQHTAEEHAFHDARPRAKRRASAHDDTGGRDENPLAGLKKWQKKAFLGS